jgi:hypothetical protein
MKFNWGTGIVISFIIFAAAIFLIILFPFNQRIDLVTKDYYDNELKYQEQINKVDRTALLDESIIINQSIKELNIKFPITYREVYGEIVFYRPSDERRDFSLSINADSTGSQSVDISSLLPGLWRVKVQWDMNNLQYYYEKNIMI